MRTLLLASFVLAACSSTPPSGDTPDAPGSAAMDGGTGSDGFTSLITTSWTLAAGDEKYLCVRATATSDIYIQSIEPIEPAGTHHEVLMLSSTPQAPDGVTECSSELTEPAIFASGVGTQRFDFPTGVGLHITAGQQLFLNVHLFNLGGDEISGTTGISYLPADPASIVHPAGSLLAGKTTGLTVIPGPSSQVGTCTTPGGSTMFAVAPHMHLLGSHMNVTYTPPGGATTTVLDTDYSFDDQMFHNLTPIETVDGGQYVVTCSYVNSTGVTVYFGESTTDEMCFAMTLMYPPPSQPTCTK